MKPNSITALDWKIIKEKYKNNLEETIKKLNESYPVQYLIGDVEFYNTKILVDERVLIPRYETEFLVEKTIQKLKELNILNPNILELGTGSGCISIALKKNIECKVTAVDISKGAISLAKENAKLNQVEINFETKDMLDKNYEYFDCIISNPPYVSKEEQVGKETKYEPQSAIFAKEEGLFFYKEIIKKIAKTVKKPKLIAFEIGYQQGDSIKELTKTYLSTYQCRIEKDLAKKERYAFLVLDE